jgi:hypothetical protein
VAVAVLSALTTSTGCAGNWLKLAAVDTGKAAAGVMLPPLPDDCRVQEPHAALQAGMEARVALRAERRATGRANARVGRCASFYMDVKDGFEKRQ